MSLTLKPTKVNLLKTFHEGARNEHEVYVENEKIKLGNLRAGNTGAVTSTGKVIGECHRVAFARWMGLESSEQPDTRSQSFFDMGYANEDVWEQRLNSAGVQFFTEDDVPINWQTSAGETVSGRPDIVIFEDNKPSLGIELKAICADNTGAKILTEGPKTKHLLQAAHYSMELGIPFVLIYSQYFESWRPFWAKTKLAQNKLEPTKIQFNLGFDNGNLYYVKPDGVRVDTIITTQMIKDFYDLVVDMRDQKSLHTRVSAIKVDGTLMKYNACDYCSLKSNCDNYEHNYDLWVDNLKKNK